VHEPPLIGLLAGEPDTASIAEAFTARARGVMDRLQDGDMAGGAQRFVEEIAFGPGAWAELAPAVQATFINNAPTWLDEMRQPDALEFDLARLDSFDRPTLLSQGDQSPPMFAPIMESLAKTIYSATRRTFVDAGHVPHMSHPADYVQALVSFVGR
jgi:pimeloyl-ACP methyl ester carboxylesterase